MDFPLKEWWTAKIGYTFGEPTFYNDFHIGVDHIVGTGTAVYAWEDMDVRKSVGNQSGNMVTFTDEKYNKKVRVMHLSQFIKTGKVNKGDIVGLSGTTGLSTGPHTHTDVSKESVQIYNTDNFVDPMVYFKNKWKVLLVCNRSTWITDEMLQPIREWFPIRIDFTLKEIDTKPVWYGEQISGVWNNKYIAVKGEAEKYDCVIHVMPEEYWKAKKSGGYFKNKKFRTSWRIDMNADEGGIRKRNNGWEDDDELLGRIRHELLHNFYKASGVEDKTHYWDFDQQEPEEALNEIDWDVVEVKEPIDEEVDLNEKYLGEVIRNANSPEHYHVSKDQIALIKDEQIFAYGRDNGWWGDWSDTITIEEEINHDLIF